MIAEHTLGILEFPKILQQLAGHTSFSASRDLATQLRPSTDTDEVRARQERTGECRRLFDDHPEVSIGGARDVRPYAQRAGRGGVLEAGQLTDIGATLASMRRLRVLLRKLDAEVYPFLSLLAESLPLLPEIEHEIERTIGEDGNVLDSASPALGRIRAEVRVAFGRLQEKLQSMITSSQYTSALQEPIITMRNGRYVVPVKAGQRRTIRGLVHDQSGSGATLYIEPIAVVELNNRWREQQLAEQEEINRILAALSDRIGAVAPQIVGGVESLALLDLFFAQAKYANALRAIQPEIVVWDDADTPDEAAAGDQHLAISQQLATAPLVLTAARHPLLDQRTVVPTDMALGGNWRLLLITGPNTGGKTVALKTTGLLALMAQAGLHIPAAAPSRVPVFGQIFADIGDEQSIEQSLSTFSSHMSNIIRILHAIDEPEAGFSENGAQSADPGSWYTVLNSQPGPALVLLDELGAGTDPVEGAALARVIIERLLERGCLGVATTHYAELKAYAYSTPGVQNASVEFNVETLAPTYKLTIGLPGRSNALAIAQRLGLEQDLVERARSTVAREDAQVEDLLAGIHQEREQAAAELARADALRADAEKYRERLSHELEEFEAQRQNREESARAELEEELRDVRAQLRRLRDDFRSVTLTRQWLEEAEQRVDVARTQVLSRKERSEQRKQSEAQARTLAQMPVAPPPPRPFEVGDRVLVRSVGLVGEIVAIDEEEQAADVQLGGFRVRAELKELRREQLSPEEERRARYRAPATVSAPPAPDVSLNFDMRGWRASEVQDRLDRYLNDAYLAGLPQVRLIHGKGTGALRQVVRDMLQGHPLIKTFGSAGQDGGDGVTVATLVER